MAKNKPTKSKIPAFKTVAELTRKVGRDIADEEMGAFAEAERQRFKQRILRQQFPSFRAIPLSAARLKQKEAFGLDLRVMIATQHYVNSIIVRRRRFLNGSIQYHVGFHPLIQARDETGKPAGILLSEVARIQEFGSHAANIPPRPHWRPHLQEMALRAMVVRQRIAARTTRRVNQILKRGA